MKIHTVEANASRDLGDKKGLVNLLFLFEL